LAREKLERKRMNPEIVIRTETSADIDAITEVTTAAFKTLEISNHTEQFIIEALRASKALTVSLVAKLDGRVIGHVAFSPVTISDATQDWNGLGPVSVLPEYQRQGIGKALIQQGLSRLKAHFFEATIWHRELNCDTFQISLLYLNNSEKLDTGSTLNVSPLFRIQNFD